MTRPRLACRLIEAGLVESVEFTSTTKHVAPSIGSNQKRRAGEVAFRAADVNSVCSLLDVDDFARLMHEFPIENRAFIALCHDEVATS